MNWETYVSIGDSITKGARTYLGYPEKTANQLKEKLKSNWNVINISENGNTTIDIVRLIDRYYNYLAEIKPGITTILIGTNDVKNGTSAEDFEIAYEALVLKARLFTQKNNVILIEIPEFTEGVSYPYNYGMNDKVRTFNTKIKQLAESYNQRSFRFMLDERDFSDGVHLNEHGVANCATQLSFLILKDKGV